jgi:serine/threonine protein phosphatase PrpC
MTKVFQFSEIGPRIENQDFIRYKSFSDYFVACIADGVGGNKNGKFIAQFVINEFIDSEESLDVSKIQKKIFEINKNVIELHKEEEFSDSATTLTIFVIKDNRLFGFHMGDSRLCILRRNGIKQLTKPHTSAYRALKAGIIDFESYKSLSFKNILENALGMESLFIDEFVFELESKDRIIISTDGFHEVLLKSELVELSKNNPNSLEDFYNELVKKIKSKELTDNSSFLIYEF